jgi:hypothetical protein
MEWVGECARDLIIAIFHLSILDLQGLPYAGDGEVASRGRPSWRHVESARAFLGSAWGEELADLIGLERTSIARRAEHLRAPATWEATRRATSPMLGKPA